MGKRGRKDGTADEQRGEAGTGVQTEDAIELFADSDAIEISSDSEEATPAAKCARLK